MVLRLILLLLETFFVLLFLICLVRGRKYAGLLVNLDGGDYFLKDIFTVGYALNDMKPFRLRGGLERSMLKNAKLYWDNQYSVYYANLTWAQFLSYAVLIAAAASSAASLLGGTSSLIVLAIAGLFIAAVWNMTISKAKEAVDSRRTACVEQFPDMVSKLSLLINSGMTLHEAWYLVARGGDEEIYKLMDRACFFMENGMSDAEAITKFGTLSDSIEIKKFTSAMVQGIEKGNAELGDFLLAQASELWATKRQSALQAGEIAAGKLVAPLGLMFAGVILIILAVALQGMSF